MDAFKSKKRHNKLLCVMQIDLGTCYQGMSTCITIYYILSHDKIYPKELQLFQPCIHLYLSIVFIVALLTHSFGKLSQSKDVQQE